MKTQSFKITNGYKIALFNIHLIDYIYLFFLSFYIKLPKKAYVKRVIFTDGIFLLFKIDYVITPQKTYSE